MLLCVDIGNTTVLFGVLKRMRVSCRFQVLTGQVLSIGLREKIKTIFKKNRIEIEDIRGIVISSVVPALTSRLSNSLRHIFRTEPMHVSPALKLGIRLGYRNPGQLGQDRLANAVAAYNLYGGPVIIVDYGTAITICFVTGYGYYRGGIILPGIQMISRALAENTALIPYVKTLKRPEKLIGQDTKESVISGLVYGISEMTDGLIRRIKKKLNTKVMVISTGGMAKFFFPYSQEIDKIDMDLTLKGLYLIYTMNRDEME